jgi:c(7)-type cytochrome triheme protein
MAQKIPLLILMVLTLSIANADAADIKDIRFNFKHAAPVVFSHASHLSQYNNNCKICHDAIFNIRERRHFTMAEMEKSKSCGACHSGVKAFSVASEKDCVLCHKGKVRNVTYKVKGAGETIFSHANHLSATRGACKSCHNGKIVTGKTKAVTMAEMEKGQSCGACHNGKPVFSVSGSCDRCHKEMKPADISFKLKGIASATFSHSLHSPSFGCKECHTKLFPYRAVVGKATMADMANGKSCGACHNGSDVFSSSENCDKCHKGYKPPGITFKTEAGDATFSHDNHLSAYKCNECHTKIFPYKAGAQKVTMAEMEQGKSCGACHNKGKDAFPVQSDCDKCHKL